ncbi:uncharacterized protein TNCV_3095381 [Trichonephila clavipes]|uniref:Uncharacterized protein n=1 Tax=Trichonephila clavipes TaxID=2585209 RepID=A0A8X6WIP0_TRICX|nr:uncharacterized protein TNCV_3095381 [Trichonephila clavipes]
MLGLTRQGCHKTVSSLLVPFLGLPDPQICLQSYLGSFETSRWASHEFERSRGKVTANMERNVSRHHTELVWPKCRIVSHRAFALEGVQQGIKSSVFLPFSLK